MTRDDLKDEYKSLSETQFIKSKKLPLEYNLKGEVKLFNESLNIKYSTNKGTPVVHAILSKKKKLSILRDIVKTFGYLKGNQIIGYEKEIKDLIPWSNIKVLGINPNMNSVTYTEEEIRKFIEENKVINWADLQRRNSTMLSSAKCLKLTKESLFPPQPLRVDPEAKINWVYAYFSRKEKIVYIGRTFSKSRDWDHRSERIGDSVFMGFKALGEPIPEWTILEDNLKLVESGEREKYWIEHYKNLGYKLLNKVSGGGLGNITAVTLQEQKEYCKNIALQCSTAHEFFAYHKKEWKKAQRNGWLKEYTWLTSTSDLNTPSREEVERVAKTCKNIFEFSQYHKHEYYYAKKWGITNELFPDKLHTGKKEWTKETAREELEKYKTRSEVIGISLWKWFLKNDLEYFNLKFPLPDLNNKEKVLEYAKRCSSYSEFKKDKNKYRYAISHGLINQIKQLFENGK